MICTIATLSEDAKQASIARTEVFDKNVFDPLKKIAEQGKWKVE